MRRWSLAVLLLCLLGVPLLAQALGGSLETIQNVAFPVFAIVLLLMPRGGRAAVPRWVPLFALSGWLIALGYRELTLSRRVPLPHLDITPGSHDAFGIRARSLERFSALIAQTYGMDVPSRIDASFAGSEAAYRWLKERNDSRLLMVSRGEDWDLVFGSAAKMIERRDRCEQSADCAGLDSLAKALDISLVQEGITVELPGSPAPLVLVARPELVHVPAEPVDLAARTLVWLTAGLRAASRSAPAAIGEAEDALFESGATFGPWKSIAPLAASSAVLGTLLIAEEAAKSGGGPLPGGVGALWKDGITALYRAKKLARKPFDPELAAMILNNLAVARFSGDMDEDSLRIALGLFEEASGVVNPKKQPVLGARIALMNLAQLSRYGMQLKERRPGVAEYAATDDHRSS